MLENILISVIVPIYNVENYLQKCIDSILKQTYTNIEVLLIDDGSTDNSGKICDEYKDKRIQIFHTSNSGVAKARNYGIERAKGKYINFVDPDDYLPADALKILLEYSEINKTDITIGGYLLEKGNTQKQYYPENEFYNKDVYIRKLLTYKIQGSPWGKLYKRSLFNLYNVRFPNFIKGQDWLMNLEMATYITIVGNVNKIVYCYYQRQSSTMHVHKTSIEYEKKYNQFIKNILIENNILKKYNKEFTHYQLSQLYTLIKAQITINQFDKWIYSIYIDSKDIKLSIKERFILLSIKYPFLQRIIRKSRISIYYLHFILTNIK